MSNALCKKKTTATTTTTTRTHQKREQKGKGRKHQKTMPSRIKNWCFGSQKQPKIGVLVD